MQVTFLRLFAVINGLHYIAGNCDVKSLRCFAVIIGQYDSLHTTARNRIGKNHVGNFFPAICGQ
jgi:hypothetical protein